MTGQVSARPMVYDIKRRTYNYALDIVKLVENLPRDTTARTIGQQLLRSGTSVGANVIEAQAASSRRDFSNFYRHALKSANESKFWLDLLKDSGKASPEIIGTIFAETDELAKILAASLLTLKHGRK